MEVKERSHQLVPAMPLPRSSSSFHKYLGQSQLEEDEDSRFTKSLRELKDLRSQLHHAADHCESSFLKATKKMMLLENTKGYICKAIVTVVDHLGNVSANLECLLHGTAQVSRTEQKIDCLTQRLRTCQQYALSVDLAAVRWNPAFPRHLPRYITPPEVSPPVEKSNGVLWDDDDQATESSDPEYPQKHEERGSRRLVTDANAKLPYAPLSSGTEFSSVLPVLDGPSILSKSSNPSLGPQVEVAYIFGMETQKKKKKKTVHGGYFMSLLRRGKRNP